MFQLPTNAFGDLSKTAKTIDYSSLTWDVHIFLMGKWSQVEHIIGGNGGRDTIMGNPLNNYIDPGSENVTRSAKRALIAFPIAYIW